MSRYLCLAGLLQLAMAFVLDHPWPASGLVFGASCVADEVAKIELTQIDSSVIHYATFQSHNQKIVSHGSKIYTAHIRTRNEPYTAQQWRLSLSRDRGKSFTTICEETLATNPPVLEIDSHGNLFLFRVDFNSGDAFLDRWPIIVSGESPERQTTRIPGGAAGKYAACLDELRDQLYFFSHNNTFHRLKRNGELVDSRQILREGKNGILQYPLLSLDEMGWLHLAWTTQKHGVYMYWDIHHLVSRDGGTTFSNLNGDSLTLPIVADDTGPAMRVTPDDEFEVHTWLSSSLGRRGHWHGLYLAQSTPPKQHYVRFDLTTGAKQIDRQPSFRGETIALHGLDGAFVVDVKRPERIFVVGNDQGSVGCLFSDDEGETWHDYARSSQSFSLYAIGSSRVTMEDGSIIGTFTDHHPTEDITVGKSNVYFFRIRTTTD